MLSTSVITVLDTEPQAQLWNHHLKAACLACIGKQAYTSFSPFFPESSEQILPHRLKDNGKA